MWCAWQNWGAKGWFFRANEHAPRIKANKLDLAGAFDALITLADADEPGVPSLSDHRHTRSVSRGAEPGKEFAAPRRGPHMKSQSNSIAHQLRFASLFNPGRGVAVPCDSNGKVDIDHLSERLKNAYLGARALVGREYSVPTIEAMH